MIPSEKVPNPKNMNRKSSEMAVCLVFKRRIAKLWKNILLVPWKWTIDLRTTKRSTEKDVLLTQQNHQIFRAPSHQLSRA
jgi:hypothetical protein